MFRGLRVRFVLFGVIAVLIATTVPVTRALDARVPVEANPFATADPAALFAQLPGTVRELNYRGSPVGFDSKRLSIYGLPDRDGALTGRLRDGTWIFISRFDSTGLVYRWTGSRSEVAGELWSPSEYDVKIEDGFIVQRFRVYSPVENCGRGARLVRRFDILRGSLHMVDSRTEPPNFPLTVAAPLPTASMDPDTYAQALADRTPGLFRQCDKGAISMMWGNGKFRYYEAARDNPYGRPMESVRFSAGAARLVAVPFVSGGSGGVFTAAVYRVDSGHPELVRVLANGGKMGLGVWDGKLRMTSPVYGPGEGGCCYSNIDRTTFIYDPVARKLRDVGTVRISTGRASPVSAAWRMPAPMPVLPAPFEHDDLSRLIATLPDTVVQLSSDVWYSSKRYDLYGFPDPYAAFAGRLADGTQVLVSPLNNPAETMIYRRTAGGTRPVGSLVAPGYVRESVRIVEGFISQTYLDSLPANACYRREESITYTVTKGTLRKVGARTRRLPLDAHPCGPPGLATKR